MLNTNNWETQIKLVKDIDNLNVDIKKKLINSILFLKEELGKGFLKTCKRNHPIKLMIENKAEWQIFQLIEFVDTLKHFKHNNSSYHILLSKFKDSIKSKNEGINFVKISQNYLYNNLKINFMAENNEKTPDIEVLNPETNEKFYIEVTALNESESRSKTSSNYRFLHNEFYHKNPVYFVTGFQKSIFNDNEKKFLSELIYNSKKN